MAFFVFSKVYEFFNGLLGPNRSKPGVARITCLLFELQQIGCALESICNNFPIYSSRCTKNKEQRTPNTARHPHGFRPDWTGYLNHFYTLLNTGTRPKILTRKMALELSIGVIKFRQLRDNSGGNLDGPTYSYHVFLSTQNIVVCLWKTEISCGQWKYELLQGDGGAFGKLSTEMGRRRKFMTSEI